jgi:3-isopropylmalate/(R)-2-methylmalate dehydratase small subunit
LFFPQAREVRPGEVLRVDPVAGRIENLSTGAAWDVAGLPSHLMAMISAGGLLPYLRQRLAGKATP